MDRLNDAPASSYIALVSQAMFQTHSGILAAHDKVKGFLVFTESARMGVARPAAGSPDDPVPNAGHGLKFQELGAQRFNAEWSYAKNTGDDRGAQFSHYDKPVMYLDPEFHDTVFDVSGTGAHIRTRTP